MDNASFKKGYKMGYEMKGAPKKRRFSSSAQLVGDESFLSGEREWIKCNASDMLLWHTKEMGRLHQQKERRKRFSPLERMWTSFLVLFKGTPIGVDDAETIASKRSFHDSIPESMSVASLMEGNCSARAYFALKDQYVRSPIGSQKCMN